MVESTWGNFSANAHDPGYYRDIGYYIYYELPWAEVDPFNDGFRRFDLTVETGKANYGGTAFAALQVAYTDGTETYVEGTSGEAGTIKRCSLTIENKTPVSLRFAYKIWINNYFGGRISFR